MEGFVIQDCRLNVMERTDRLNFRRPQTAKSWSVPQHLSQLNYFRTFMFLLVDGRLDGTKLNSERISDSEFMDEWILNLQYIFIAGAQSGFFTSTICQITAIILSSFHLAVVEGFFFADPNSVEWFRYKKNANSRSIETRWVKNNQFANQKNQLEINLISHLFHRRIL